jgi:hypothetical protein
VRRGTVYLVMSMSLDGFVAGCVGHADAFAKETPRPYATTPDPMILDPLRRPMQRT